MPNISGKFNISLKPGEELELLVGRECENTIPDRGTHLSYATVKLENKGDGVLAVTRENPVRMPRVDVQIFNEK